MGKGGFGTTGEPPGKKQALQDYRKIKGEGF